MCISAYLPQEEDNEENINFEETKSLMEQA